MDTNKFVMRSMKRDHKWENSPLCSIWLSMLSENQLSQLFSYKIALYYACSLWDQPTNISLPATGVKLCKLFTYLLKKVKPPGDTLPEVSAPLWRPSK